MNTNLSDIVLSNPFVSVPPRVPRYVPHNAAPRLIQIVCLFSLRYSHGEVVFVSELRDFLEADLTNLQQGSSCLAKHEDGIWYPAKISGTTSHSSCQNFSTVPKGHNILKKKTSAFFICLEHARLLCTEVLAEIQFPSSSVSQPSFPFFLFAS